MKILKKLKKSKIAILIFSEVIIVIILRFMGFRITYNPKLDDNWDAIAACGTWFCGCIVPIAVVLIQHKISETEKKTSASNVALLEEVNLLKKKSSIEGVVSISSDEIYRYICIKMIASTEEIAEHFGVKTNEIRNQLEDLWAVTKLIRTVSLEDDPYGHFEKCQWRKA